MNAYHPLYAEPVGKRSELAAPERFLQRHADLPALGQRRKDAFAFCSIVRRERERDIVLAVRSRPGLSVGRHKLYIARNEASVHDLILEAWIHLELHRRARKATYADNLATQTILVKVQRFFTASVKKKIWFQLHFCSPLLSVAQVRHRNVELRHASRGFAGSPAPLTVNIRVPSSETCA